MSEKYVILHCLSICATVRRMKSWEEGAKCKVGVAQGQLEVLR